jgi:hypothetical protein
MKELSEKRYVEKAINAMIRYGQSKLGGFEFDAQTMRYGDTWRITITVGWVPQPLTPVITDLVKPEGSI